MTVRDEPARPTRRHPAAWAAAAAGVTLAAASLIGWRLGLLPGMPVRAWLVLALFGAAVFALALWHRPIAAAHGTLAGMALNTVLLLLAVEGAATVANGLARRAQAPQVPLDPAMEEVHRAGGVKPQLYVGWQGRPHKGTAINVDERGLRRTPGAPSPAGVRPVRIYTFGGSTMWGEGASDDQTIAAHLQAMLSQRAGVPVEVTNFGQRAWVSTQGLIKLMLEMQRGAAPDIVVSYDGYNDVFAAFATGEAGVPEDFGNQRELAQMPALRRALIGTQTFQLVQRWAVGEPERRLSAPQSTALAREVVDVYLRTHELAQALARHHGSEVRFFWQPQLIVGTKPLTAQEQAIARQHYWLPPAVRDLTRDAYAMLAASLPREGVVDLSDVFDKVPDPVYFDPCHVNGLGNRVVAQAMVERGLLDAVRRVVIKRAGR